MIVYGLKNYFRKELKALIENCDAIVISFDESMNSIQKKQQMDILIRFWNSKQNEVSTRYFTSAFLGHARAVDLLQAFNDNILPAFMKKIIQISMDGSNVNLKFLKDMQQNLSHCHHGKQLIDIGSCGLHVLHNAFKTSIQIVKWKVAEFLRALFNLFNYSPARRSEFTNITKSDQFPKNFCGVRWLENVAVAQRAAQMLPKILTYIEKLKKDKIELVSKSYDIVKKAVPDKLLSAKLAFFQAFASEIEPFLTEFQSNDPKTPFLFDRLSILYLDIMKRIAKPESLQKFEKNILKIDLNDTDNLLTADKVKIGYVTKNVLKNIKDVSAVDKLHFKNECGKIMKSFLIKIAQKSPLKFSIVKGLSCFNPIIALDIDNAERRLSIVLEKFVENNLLLGTVAEKVEKEFRQIISLKSTQEKLRDFKASETRLDHFWVRVLEMQGFKNYENLFTFMKHVMILSHGNAAAERSFSVNKECIVENQKEESLIAQRVICDAVSSMNEPLVNFQINKTLIKEVRLSSSLYKQALEDNKKKCEKGEELE